MNHGGCIHGKGLATPENCRQDWPSRPFSSSGSAVQGALRTFGYSNRNGGRILCAANGNSIWRNCLAALSNEKTQVYSLINDTIEQSSAKQDGADSSGGLQAIYSCLDETKFSLIICTQLHYYGEPEVLPGKLSSAMKPKAHVLFLTTSPRGYWEAAGECPEKFKIIAGYLHALVLYSCGLPLPRNLPFFLLIPNLVQIAIASGFRFIEEIHDLLLPGDSDTYALNSALILEKNANNKKAYRKTAPVEIRQGATNDADTFLRVAQGFLDIGMPNLILHSLDHLLPEPDGTLSAEVVSDLKAKSVIKSGRSDETTLEELQGHLPDLGPRDGTLLSRTPVLQADPRALC